MASSLSVLTAPIKLHGRCRYYFSCPGALLYVLPRGVSGELLNVTTGDEVGSRRLRPAVAKREPTLRDTAQRLVVLCGLPHHRPACITRTNSWTLVGALLADHALVVSSRGPAPCDSTGLAEAALRDGCARHRTSPAPAWHLIYGNMTGGGAAHTVFSRWLGAATYGSFRSWRQLRAADLARSRRLAGPPRSLPPGLGFVTSRSPPPPLRAFPVFDRG